jgi:hypothetical protein
MKPDTDMNLLCGSVFAVVQDYCCWDIKEILFVG